MRDKGTATVDVVGVAAAVAFMGWKHHPRIKGDRLKVLIVLDRRREVSEIVQEVGEVHHLFVPSAAKKGG